nr:exopolysaccharide biosynthesis protein [Parvularcula dongshanensis]
MLSTDAARSDEDEAPAGAGEPEDVTALILLTLDKAAAVEGKADVSLGRVLDSLDERGFGLLLLVLALPCCIPFLWGIPQVVSLPMLAVAFQIARGAHRPWLPASLRARRFSVERMKASVTRVHRYIGWIERLARPRLSAVVEGAGLRIVGALLLVPTISILMPFPGSNTAPGIGVAIVSVGLLEKDGLLTLAGLVFGLAWVVFLVTIFVLLGAEATSIVKEFTRGLVSGTFGG